MLLVVVMFVDLNDEDEKFEMSRYLADPASLFFYF